jgi:hypothetical protein
MYASPGRYLQRAGFELGPDLSWRPPPGRKHLIEEERQGVRLSRPGSQIRRLVDRRAACRARAATSDDGARWVAFLHDGRRFTGSPKRPTCATQEPLALVFLLLFDRRFAMGKPSVFFRLVARPSDILIVGPHRWCRTAGRYANCRVHTACRSTRWRSVSGHASLARRQRHSRNRSTSAHPARQRDVHSHLPAPCRC